jgi:hypothetical protein
VQPEFDSRKYLSHAVVQILSQAFTFGFLSLDNGFQQFLLTLILEPPQGDLVFDHFPLVNDHEEKKSGNEHNYHRCADN